jgi:hypothetical protein
VDIPNLRIRIAGALGAVLTVHARKDRRHCPVTASDPESQTWARMMHTADLRVYLADIDGTPVGTASATAMPNITYDSDRAS